MKNLIKITLATLFLALPAQAFAKDAKEMSEKTMANCPAMAEMQTMQSQMHDMMGQMDQMMGQMTDPAMKERMGMMHNNMQEMMAHMHQMHQNMMDSGMHQHMQDMHQHQGHKAGMMDKTDSEESMEDNHDAHQH